jgi:bifunctional pyridoxal-dependent enzyme with beta-cystathionase and maltose regulon repressor activities
MKTRFKTLGEFYKAIDNLIERLMASDFVDDAAKLNLLIHETAWTTGSELLGELQLALKDMRGKFPEEVNEEINECYVFTVHHREINPGANS